MSDNDELAQELENTPEPAIDIQPISSTGIPEAPEDYMVLRFPRPTPYSEGYEFVGGNMKFGSASPHEPGDALIRFTAQGDGDGYAIVRENHPLLADLMRRYPQIEVVESNPKPEAFVCEICGKQTKTAKAMVNHKRSHS